MIDQMAPYSATLTIPNPDFKVTPLFDTELEGHSVKRTYLRQTNHVTLHTQQDIVVVQVVVLQVINCKIHSFDVRHCEIHLKLNIFTLSFDRVTVIN